MADAADIEDRILRFDYESPTGFKPKTVRIGGEDIPILDTNNFIRRNLPILLDIHTANSNEEAEHFRKEYEGYHLKEILDEFQGQEAYSQTTDLIGANLA